MKTWVIKIGTSILRVTEETSTEEIIETKMHTKKIMRLSILDILIGCFTGT